MAGNKYCHWRQEDGIWYIVGSVDVVHAGEEVEVETKDGDIQTIKIASLGRKIIGWDGAVLQVGIPEPIDTATRLVTDRQKALLRRLGAENLDLYEQLLKGRDVAAMTMNDANEAIEALLDAQQS
jgi:hypothetical protein